MSNVVSTYNFHPPTDEKRIYGNFNPYKVNIILYKAKSKGRVAKTKKGHRQQSNYSQKNARRAHEPSSPYYLLDDI